MPASLQGGTDSVSKSQWISRVLEVAIPDSGANPDNGLAVQFAAARDGFSDAIAAVGRQMTALKQALLASGDPDYEEIAEAQLDGVIGDGLGKLAAALGRAGVPPEPAIAAKLQTAAGAMLKDLLGNPHIMACDNNPVQAPVAIRTTLAPAFARLQSVLQQAVG